MIFYVALMVSVTSYCYLETLTTQASRFASSHHNNIVCCCLIISPLQLIWNATIIIWKHWQHRPLPASHYCDSAADILGASIAREGLVFDFDKSISPPQKNLNVPVVDTVLVNVMGVPGKCQLLVSGEPERRC